MGVYYILYLLKIVFTISLLDYLYTFVTGKLVKIR